MATTVSDQMETHPGVLPDSESAAAMPSTDYRVSITARWLAAGALVLIVLVVSLLAWGPGMEYPTSVSSSQLETSGSQSIQINRSVRDVTGSAIDDGVGWMTREGSWLFNGLSVAVTLALLYIENGLKWLPWPAVICVFVARFFRSGALAAAGVYAHSHALHWVHGTVVKPDRHHRADGGGGGPVGGSRIPHGSTGRSQAHGRQFHAPDFGRNADHAQLRLPAAGNTVLWAGKARGYFRNNNLRHSPDHPPDQPGNPTSFPPKRSKRRGPSALRPPKCC